MSVSYLISLSSTNIVGIAVAIDGFFAGPVLGVFTMGLFMPWINYKVNLVRSCKTLVSIQCVYFLQSVSIGFAVGVFCVLFVGISSMMIPEAGQAASMLPLSVENCPKSKENYTTDIFTTVDTITDRSFEPTMEHYSGINRCVRLDCQQDGKKFLAVLITLFPHLL